MRSIFYTIYKFYALNLNLGFVNLGFMNRQGPQLNSLEKFERNPPYVKLQINLLCSLCETRWNTYTNSHTSSSHALCKERLIMTPYQSEKPFTSVQRLVVIFTLYLVCSRTASAHYCVQHSQQHLECLPALTHPESTSRYLCEDPVSCDSYRSSKVQKQLLWMFQRHSSTAWKHRTGASSRHMWVKLVLRITGYNKRNVSLLKIQNFAICYSTGKFKKEGNTFTCL
jgi:hypothetical protein